MPFQVFRHETVAGYRSQLGSLSGGSVVTGNEAFACRRTTVGSTRTPVTQGGAEVTEAAPNIHFNATLKEKCENPLASRKLVINDGETGN
jgi:hypothetical protein